MMKHWVIYLKAYQLVQNGRMYQKISNVPTAVIEKRRIDGKR
jgi:hypothetical protein